MPLIDPKLGVRKVRRVLGTLLGLLPWTSTNPKPGAAPTGWERPRCTVTVCDRPWNLMIHGRRICTRCPWNSQTDL